MDAVKAISKAKTILQDFLVIIPLKPLNHTYMHNRMILYVINLVVYNYFGRESIMGWYLGLPQN